MPEVLVVGESGFLSQAMLKAWGSRAQGLSWREALYPSQLAGAQWVLNGALDPRQMSELLSPEEDFDLQLAQKAVEAGAHYVMLSTRKVYDRAAQWGAREDDLAVGQDVYGQNKAQTEARIREVVPEDRLLIARVANVVGPERVPGRRSFMAMMLGSLADRGEISFNMSPFVRRDFITDRFFADSMKGLVESGASGLVNVGSGQPLMTGELAMALLEGFGQGSFRVTDPRVFDEFWLDVSRLKSWTGLEADPESVRELCREEGRKLASG